MRKIMLPLLLLCAAALRAAEPGEQIVKAVKEHARAVHIKDGWIRDPYIVSGPDGFYYLTGTTLDPGDPAEYTKLFNGPGQPKGGKIGHAVRLWRSADLASWEYLGEPYVLERDAWQYNPRQENLREAMWAPELHWTGERWVLVHCPSTVSNLALSAGGEPARPWNLPSPRAFNMKHDPSLFCDNDGIWYMTWGNGLIAKIKPGFKGFDGQPARIDPADRQIGHEGTLMLRIGGKYVLMGTGWSTDRMRDGSYNLYYCVADSPFGPFGPRRFAGRFLGHGTPFRDREGNWWCTAFYNADVPPVDDDDIRSRDLSGTARTINPQGVTIVPLDVRVLPGGDVYIRAKDPRYSEPGPDEAQKF